MSAAALRRFATQNYSTPSVKTGLSDRVIRRTEQIEASSAALNQFEHKWLERATEKILSLSKLEHGWDSYQGVPLDKSLADYATHVLRTTITASTPEGSVHPLSGGGLQIEWHIGGQDLEITIYRPYEIEVSYMGVDGTEQTFTVDQDVSRLRKLLTQIAE